MNQATSRVYGVLWYETVCKISIDSKWDNRPRKFRKRISGSSSSVISKWIYKLKPYKNQTVVTMRQTTEIKGAFDRFVAHYIDKFISESDGFLFELDRRLKMVSNVDVASMDEESTTE